MSLTEERHEKTIARNVATRSGTSARDGAASSAALLRRGGDSQSRENFAFSVGSQTVSTPVGQGRTNYSATGADSGALSIRPRSWWWVRGSSQPSAFYLVAKRCLDVAFAVGALVLLFPLLLIVGIAIVLEDGGPVLYYQDRIGRSGKPFRFYKFRSMIRNADQIKDKLAHQNEASGPIFKMKNDPRITRVGRFLRRSSIDELPQLLNVLRGEMSFVGPRPQLPREVERYTERQHRRLLVQPGLVCLREVFGRSNLTFDQWVEMDLLYIENRSLSTDFGVLLRLIPAVLRGDGAY